MKTFGIRKKNVLWKGLKVIDVDKLRRSVLFVVSNNNNIINITGYSGMLYKDN